MKSEMGPDIILSIIGTETVAQIMASSIASRTGMD
jgi:hypothetical protein